MKLKKIFKNILPVVIKGSKEIKITGITNDSRVVAPGNLFIARKGKSFDATELIPKAIEAGAIAVVSDMYNPFLGKIVQIISDDVASIEADIAANYYQYPSMELLSIGITGTNGKTTTSYLIKHILDHVDKTCGVIGTIEHITGKNRISASRTTPDCVTLQKLLREMVINNCKSVVMEVTSHALDQERIKNVGFDIAIFTNLTQDHLDYHGDMNSYALAKAKLFSMSKNSQPVRSIINHDSPYFEMIKSHCQGKVFSYGIDTPSDLQAIDIVCTAKKTEFTAIFQEQKIHISSPLIGKFNVYNILSAMSCALLCNIDLITIASLMQSFTNVPGRMEKIVTNKNIYIFVDYAHTPDALENILLTLQSIKREKIITVFGCGGQRDQEKRSKMACIAEKYADFSIVTNDNPRNEDPQKIIDQIISGFVKKSSYCVEVDRYKAIEKALQMAKKDDIVLIAGKGHETYQIFEKQTIYFDDRKVAQEICKKIGK